jgi:hypothetical protein
MLEVLGQVDGCHAAGTNLPLDGIAIRKGGGEAVELVWQRAAPVGRDR